MLGQCRSPLLVQCRSIVFNAGPTLKQNSVIVPCCSDCHTGDALFPRKATTQITRYIDQLWNSVMAGPEEFGPCSLFLRVEFWRGVVALSRTTARLPSIQISVFAAYLGNPWGGENSICFILHTHITSGDNTSIFHTFATSPISNYCPPPPKSQLPNHSLATI